MQGARTARPNGRSEESRAGVGNPVNPSVDLRGMGSGGKGAGWSQLDRRLWEEHQVTSDSTASGECYRAAQQARALHM